jgi:putative Mn2+ efflux pump MntP
MFFMSAAIFFGDMILCFVDAYVAKMLGVIILLLMGIFIICKSFFQVDDYDFDQSEHIDFMEALYLGLAISIDAFAAGVGNSVSGCNNMWLPVCVALCQGLFLKMGLVLGRGCAYRLHIKQSVFNFISGVLLIVLAIFRFI